MEGEIMEIEYELNRRWIYNNKNEKIIGEVNFVVPKEWLVNTFNKLNDKSKFICKYENFEAFIDSYEPETDGELIYQCSIKDGSLKKDLGTTMYYKDLKHTKELLWR